MKNLIGALILGVLLSTGLLASSYEKRVRPVSSGSIGVADQSASPVSINKVNQPASPVSIGEVLRAHNVPQNPDALSSFDAEAVRLTSRPPGIPHELQSFFERRVRVVMAGNVYKRHTADRLRLREQYDLFDGNLPYHAVVENGSLVAPANLVTDAESRGVELGIKTFGLVPILKQLADSTTEAIYLGRTVYGQDKFDVKTATDRWTLYTDAEHLISRVEMRGKTIEYASYRAVDGVRLPFVQRLSSGGQLVQELNFTRITLNPKLPSSTFSREALAKDMAR
jgi:hypothetical protein